MSRLCRFILLKVTAFIVLWFAPFEFAYAGIPVVQVPTAIIAAPDSIAPSSVGIATLRHGPYGIIVFGVPLKIDPIRLQSQAGFSHAQVNLLPDATVITLPVTKAEMLSISSHIASWSISIEPRKQSSQIAFPLVQASQIVFPLTKPATSAMVPDPVTGEPLLVGTVTGETAIQSDLHAVGYSVLPAWRGVVVQASSDELVLKPVLQGFSLTNIVSNHLPALDTLAVPQNDLEVADVNHSLGLPTGSVINLRHRLLRAQIALATAPPLDQLPASLRLARVLLALGMAPEAKGVLENALRTDPASDGNVSRERLVAVAGLLNNDPGPASRLKPRDLGQTHEMRFWQGIALAQQGHVKSAAKLLKDRVPVLLGYSQPLQTYLAPRVAEILLAGGKIAAVQQLLHALPKQRGLDLARADVLEATHHPVAALAAYQSLQQSQDVRVSGIATTRDVLLRYSLKQISAKEASLNLAQDLYAWRGPRHEMHMRLALAKLRAEAGEWAEALHGLQQAIILLPQSTEELQNERQNLFKTLITSGALNRLGPLEAVTTIEENEDLIPPGADGVPVLHVLAHRLSALDLPGIAAPVLKNLIARTEAGSSRVRLGLALARVDLQSDNLQGAEAALAQANATDLSPDLAAQRAFLLAEIKARGGHVSSAIESLANSNDEPAMAFKTRLQLAAHDWKSAEATLQARVANLKPQLGMLRPEAAHLVTELATAASNAGDEAELARMRAQYDDRMPRGPNADLFHALTTAPVDPNAGLSVALKQIASIERLGAALPGSRPNSSMSR